MLCGAVQAARSRQAVTPQCTQVLLGCAPPTPETPIKHARHTYLALSPQRLSQAAESCPVAGSQCGSQQPDQAYEGSEPGM